MMGTSRAGKRWSSPVAGLAALAMVVAGCVSSPPQTAATSASSPQTAASASPPRTAAASASPPQTAPRQLTIALVPGTIQAFYPYLAIQKGFFAKRGVKAEIVYVQTGPQLITALLGGNADIAMAGPQLLWPTLERGSDVKVLMGAVKLNYMLVSCPGTPLSRAGAAFPEQLLDLKGRSVGVIGPGTQTETFAKTLIAAAGLTPGKDVTIVAVGGNATGIPACVERKVDFNVVNPPQQLRLGVQGKDYTILADALDPRTTKDLFTGFLADTYSVAGPFLAKHRDTVDDFCRVMADTRSYAADPRNLDEVARAFAEHQNVPIQGAAEAFKSSLSTLLVPINQAIWDRQGQSIAGALRGYTPSYDQFVYPECSRILEGGKN